MNSKLPLLITLDAVKCDPALQPESRGARKIGVTSLYPKSEYPCELPKWQGSSDLTPVLVFPDTEFAVFNQHAFQDRHYHAKGTELYTVLEGTFEIEVEKNRYLLSSGDTIIVPAGAVHEVLRHSEFTASVVTVRCEGVSDKYVV